MSSFSTLRIIGVAALVCGSSLPAFAEAIRHRHVHHRHLARASVVPGPAIVDEGAIGPDIGYDPRVRNGQDDLGLRPVDGVAVGQGPSFLGPDSNDGTGLGRAERYQGRGFEIEAPPIGPSLPILPAYADPALFGPTEYPPPGVR